MKIMCEYTDLHLRMYGWEKYFKENWLVIKMVIICLKINNLILAIILSYIVNNFHQQGPRHIVGSTNPKNPNGAHSTAQFIYFFSMNFSRNTNRKHKLRAHSPFTGKIDAEPLKHVRWQLYEQLVCARSRREQAVRESERAILRGTQFNLG